MTEPDEALRGALRDLIPDYTGPSDPMSRVAVSVRRRRVRQRTLLAVGAAGVAAVVALAGPALLWQPGGGGVQAAGPGGSAGPVPTASGDNGPPAGPPPVYPVASGTLAGVDWAIGSTTLAAGARRCLYSDDQLFRRAADCFDQWKGDRPVWTAAAWDTGVRPATRVVGVAPRDVAAVRVRFADGSTEVAPAASTATDRSARFFGLVVPGPATVADVTPLDAAGTALGPPFTDPGVPPCRPGPSVACVPK